MIHRLRILAILLGVLCAPAFAAAGLSFGSFVAAADLDGDHQIDLATASGMRRDGAGYVLDITFRLSSVEAGVITVRTPGIAGRLSARDLDGDADRDLILESFDRQPLAVLLNDGGGHFHQVDLDDFRARLKQPDSGSVEDLAPRSDSPETGESPASPAAAPASAATQPALGAAKTARSSSEHSLGSEHSVTASRAPPAFR